MLFYILFTIKTLLKIETHTHNFCFNLLLNNLLHISIVIIWGHQLFWYTDSKITRPKNWWVYSYSFTVYKFKKFIVYKVKVFIGSLFRLYIIGLCHKVLTIKTILQIKRHTHIYIFFFPSNGVLHIFIAVVQIHKIFWYARSKRTLPKNWW